MTRKDRILRLLGGAALVLGGGVGFAISSRLDPANRAAWIFILAILFGITYVGQALRPHHEAPRPAAPETGPLGLNDRAYGLMLAWLVPGLGHFVLGRKGKGVLYAAVITATFVAGVLLAEGRNLDFRRDPLYFIAYGWNGLQTLVGWALARGLERDHVIPFLGEGYLYSAVAGLLNAVAMMDLLRMRAPSRQEAAT
jgi:hypothetical protein